MSEPKVIHEGVAESLPTESRLTRFKRLAKLISKCYCKADERCAYHELAMQMFDVLRALTILDESFRLPTLDAGTEENKQSIEEKFAVAMANVSLTTLRIQQAAEQAAEKPKVII